MSLTVPAGASRNVATVLTEMVRANDNVGIIVQYDEQNVGVTGSGDEYMGVRDSPWSANAMRDDSSNIPRKENAKLIYPAAFICVYIDATFLVRSEINERKQIISAYSEQCWSCLDAMNRHWCPNMA